MNTLKTIQYKAHYEILKLEFTQNFTYFIKSSLKAEGKIPGISLIKKGHNKKQPDNKKKTNNGMVLLIYNNTNSLLK